MEHTECKDCELSSGDCGYHFEMDGKTNYDIASLTACDKYGNCMFFKAKAKPQGDLISREALKAYARQVICGDNPTNTLLIRTFDEIIDNAPSDADRPHGEWIDHSEEGYVECPFCEHLTNCEDNIDELHYCWNCGAYMRKGGAK